MARVEVDFNVPLKNVHGKPIELTTEEDKEEGVKRYFTVGHVIANPLWGTWQGDERSAQVRRNDAKLVLEMTEDEYNYKVLSLTDKQRKHLKDIVGELVKEAGYYMQIIEVLGFAPEETEEDDED